ncbi:hypothetical protein BJF79_49020 [Actinomadura sp. CNU-125]|uniref:hypothetical protein n=1 Tax=Actinomadura sp. CNU-125 TaxID=1904961 RepID=UPI0009614EC5|nr:hypothetical protein [Actinomadura sp. CNU-125]OLT14488.1 hypothetical protein BJF79_49020 [Actinomadura sp. CNU-125]
MSRTPISPLRRWSGTSTHFNNEIARAQNALRQARERELDARKIRDRTRDRLLLSNECPHVGRAAGDVTVAVRDAWVNTQLDTELWIYRTAKVQREDAEAYVWAIKDQIEVLRSIGVLSRQAFDLSGRTR